MTTGTRLQFNILLLLNKLVRQGLKLRATPVSPRKSSARHTIQPRLLKGSCCRT